MGNNNKPTKGPPPVQQPGTTPVQQQETQNPADDDEAAIAERLAQVKQIVQALRSQMDDDSKARCLMFFPTSGRMGFGRVETSDELPPVETLREMIAYETNIRLSESVQELMEFYHTKEAALSALFRSHAFDGLRFMVIYIAEAHARDQWPMGKTISCVDQPITMEQRIENARQCQQH
ncbi:unnamed protein product, partial [Rotaria sp. Silwood1]